MVLALHEKVENEKIYQAFGYMGKKEFDSAENLLQEGLEEAKAQKDAVLSALFFSTLGVLHKFKKDFQKAWKYYERAEQLMPQDAALKLMMAQLMTDVFGQNEEAIAKCERVLQLAKSEPVIYHQALATIGLAHLRKGERGEAIQFLVDAMEDDFAGLGTSENINLRLLEALLHTNVGHDESFIYLEKAKEFAEEKSETNYVNLFDRLLKKFPEPTEEG